MPAPGTVIRDPRPDDEAAWRRLWSGYLTFYKVNVSEAVTAATWQRLFVPSSGMFGRIAECDGAVSGFTVSVVHPRSWALKPICYLEDLFVDPNLRGRGLGRALIEDLVALGRERGWSGIYWHTQEGNATARLLYDRLAKADDFVRYSISLNS
jgi:GNAT superfamily N-acetyltransferase